MPLTVSGEVPDAARPPTGCRFHPRCPLVEEVCRTLVPGLAPIGGDHLVSCHVVSREGRGATTLIHGGGSRSRQRPKVATVRSPQARDRAESTPLSAGVELLPRLRGLAPSLVPSQRRVAEQILADPSTAATLTISELAAAADTSETTVVRLCRQLGVRGYRDLRVALAGEGGRAQERAGSREIGPDIAASDSLDVVIAKITYADSEAIADTARLLDRAELGAVVDALVVAPRVDVFGVGASAFVAMDLQQKLHRIGLISFSWADQHAALTAAALLRPGDVAIGVSHTGSTKDTVETIDLARANGAITVALTSVPRSPLADAVHHRLITASRETTFRSGAMGSRIAALERRGRVVRRGRPTAVPGDHRGVGDDPPRGRPAPLRRRRRDVDGKGSEWVERSTAAPMDGCGSTRRRSWSTRGPPPSTRRAPGTRWPCSTPKTCWWPRR